MQKYENNLSEVHPTILNFLIFMTIPYKNVRHVSDGDIPDINLLSRSDKTHHILNDLR